MLITKNNIRNPAGEEMNAITLMLPRCHLLELFYPFAVGNQILNLLTSFRKQLRAVDNH